MERWFNKICTPLPFEVAGGTISSMSGCAWTTCALPSTAFAQYGLNADEIPSGVSRNNTFWIWKKLTLLSCNLSQDHRLYKKILACESAMCPVMFQKLVAIQTSMFLKAYEFVIDAIMQKWWNYFLEPNPLHAPQRKLFSFILAIWRTLQATHLSFSKCSEA
jgi:hypothetical protein